MFARTLGNLSVYTAAVHLLTQCTEYQPQNPKNKNSYTKVFVVSFSPPGQILR